MTATAFAAPERPLPAEVDVVVIGAGHNGLICAAYLAQAGLEVCVLEARDIIGGNTVTEELTLPGYAHDSCSSAHVLIQSNPVIRDDELGLQATYGLTYVHTDPAVVLPLAGGDTLVVHRDLEATVAEVSRFSAEDGAQLRTMIRDWESRLGRPHGRWNQGLAPEDDAATREYDALRARSAWDVVHERFRHPVVRDLLMWLGFATIQDPRRLGTGALPAAITAGRLTFGWATPLGGSGALPAALVAHIEDHGGTVIASAPVAAVDTSAGRAGAVTTADGRRVSVRRAVVSSAHLASLGALVSAGRSAPPQDLEAARRSWRPGLSLFAVHAALRADLSFPSAAGPVVSVAGGLGTANGLAQQLDLFDRGQPDANDPWLLLVASTVVDPGRVPSGGGTLKLLTVAPHTRADGRTWDESGGEYAAALMELVHARTNLARSHVLRVVAETPTSLAERNPHNVGGSCHGGEFVTADGSVIPGWTSYESSIPGLFITGSTAHPGGSVSGRPGRNAARAVLTALGFDASSVMPGQ